MSFFKNLFGGKKEEVKEEVVQVPTERQGEVLQAPLTGQVVALNDVKDPVFASGAMGQGVAIKPSQGEVYAPADAEVTIAFATGHAYGLKTASGAEVLIHVGIDTVSMEGKGFDQKVAQGDKVKAGQLIGTFDAAEIAAAGLDDTTMIIITNTAEYAAVETLASGSIEKGQDLLKLSLD